MAASFFHELKDDLRKGATQKGHPYNFFTFATVGSGKIARLRTVVLRNVSDDLILTFYTDKRSKKILHIKENNKVSLLFYHPEKLVQLKIEGIATLDSNLEANEKIWSTMNAKARKEYTTLDAPGSKTTKLGEIEYLDSENHFSTIEINPFKIEYLKIQQPNHLKIRFSKKSSGIRTRTTYSSGEYNEWESEFLVP